MSAGLRWELSPLDCLHHAVDELVDHPVGRLPRDHSFDLWTPKANLCIANDHQTPAEIVEIVVGE